MHTRYNCKQQFAQQKNIARALFYSGKMGMSKKKKSINKKPTNETPSTPSVAPSKIEPGDEPAPNTGANFVKPSISRYFSFLLLLVVVALVGILFYEVMAQFVIPLFLAAVLVVIFRPLYKWIDKKCGGREQLSALLTTAAVLLAVLIPIGALLIMAAAEGRHFYNQFNQSQF